MFCHCFEVSKDDRLYSRTGGVIPQAVGLQVPVFEVRNNRRRDDRGNTCCAKARAGVGLNMGV